MNHLSRTILVLTLGIFIGVGITLERTVFAERKDSLEPLPLEELHNFAEIFGRIKSDYVEQVEDKKLIEDAIQGMLAGLDPHSAYLTPESYKEVRIGTDGEFGGLGIEVSMENGFVKVVSPIDDTPAQRAGMRAGDLIIRINEQAVKGMSLNDAVQKMRGKPGTDITLTLVREGVDAPFEVTLTRAVIVIRSVRNRLLEDGYGYVRISQFQANTADAMRQAISAMKKESGGELKGLVLDLRNNPGGVLNAAVAVSDAFLDKGRIVYTEGRVQDSQLTFNATPGDFMNRAPMVVLVNEGSASASEIVAGALQDQKRAVIMGTKTFGKGSVQTILPMRSGAALKITTARYFTPGGRSIQATGIEPDVVVEDLQLTRRDAKTGQPLREADLSGHLENGTTPEAGAAPGGAAAPAAPAAQTAFRPEDDYQLNEALNLLKGVNIVRAQQQG